MADITQLLDAARTGDPKAASELLPLVYGELRKLAAARLAGEQAGHTLRATALVHEAYLRLVGDAEPQDWNGRGHFFAAAAEAMRRILVEAARRRHRLKRGAGRDRLDLDLDALAAPAGDERLLALDDALTRFATLQPAKAELVKLRWFAGMSMDEAAAALGISPATADRWWAFARAWLRVEASGESLESAPDE